MSNISPLRSNPREDGITDSERSKPQEPPRTDNFRKSMRERAPAKRETQERQVEDHEEPPSVFDLSKSKTKSKSSLSEKSTLKGSEKDSDSSTLVSKRPLTPKQDLSEQEQDQHPQEDTLLASDSNDISQATEDLYATAQEKPPAPQDQIAKQTKPPVQRPLEGLKPEQTVVASAQKPKVSREESSFETRELGSTSKKQKTSKSEGSKSDAAEVKEGAAGPVVNASIQSTGFHSEKMQESQETARSATIREIAAQIVDKIQVLRTGDETKTTITLRQPPILEGATITLTATDNAKREFNIAFANLSTDGKIFLDRKLKEDPLTDRLKREDITVHILTTSTQRESIITADAGQASRDRQDQQQQQQQQQQQRRQGFRGPEEEEE